MSRLARGRRALSALALALAIAVPLTVVVAVLAPVAAPRAGALPPGFTVSDVAALPSGTGIEQLPDGRVVVLQQGGQVRIIDRGVLLPAPALSLSLCTGGERGMLGFTADPEFLSNGVVYLYWTRPSSGAPGGCVNRVSRFVMHGDVIDRSSEIVLLDGISSVNGNHNGGDLAIGRDGYLYVSVGDAGADPRGDSGAGGANDAAQDLSLLNGKILRVDRTTGAAAPDNPLVGAGGVACRVRGNVPSTPTSPCAEVFAWGLRNPWRIVFDPNDRAAHGAAPRFFINDVGQSAREEVDLGAAGADYGWNAREGQCPRGGQPPCAGPPAGVTDPIVDYAHTGSRSFITGGAFVPDGAWPTAYRGAYLFADGGSGEIFLRRADGSVDLGAPFAAGLPGIADMTFVREVDGWSLWMTTAGPAGVVRRIAAPAVPPPPSPPSPALAFTPLPASTRLLDTRIGIDGGIALDAGVPRSLSTGVDGSVTRAVLVNLAYVQPAMDGFLTAWAGDAPRPPTANVNAEAGEVVSNLAVVPVDAAGRMLLSSYADAHVVVDLLGRFDAVAGAVAAGRFRPVDPVRLADTRDVRAATDAFERIPPSPYPRVRVPVLGRGGVPRAGVASVVLVVTALSDAQPAGGFLTASASGAPWPGTANANTNGSGDIRPNTVVVPVGADGAVDLHLFQVADVVVDVAGWFTDGSAPASTSGRFVSIAPTREADTRIALGLARFAAGATQVLDPVSVPADAAALAHGIAIVDNAAPGFVTPFPGGERPLVAAGNVTAPGQVRSILTFTKLAPGGTMSYFSYSATDLVVDVTGWFER